MPTDVPTDEPPYLRHGRMLKSLRTRTGMTQRQVWEETGISLPTLRTYEQGRTLPNAAVLALLRRALGIDVNAYLDAFHVGSSTEGES